MHICLTKISPRFSVPERDGTQHMILCRVICGESCLGNSTYDTQIPNKPNAHHSYETMVNSLTDPTIYVVAKDNQAYPEFLISFKNKKQKQKEEILSSIYSSNYSSQSSFANQNNYLRSHQMQSISSYNISHASSTTSVLNTLKSYSNSNVTTTTATLTPAKTAQYSTDNILTSLQSTNTIKTSQKKDSSGCVIC